MVPINREKRVRILWFGLSMLFIALFSPIYAQQIAEQEIPKGIQNRMTQTYEACIDNKKISFHIKENQLFYTLHITSSAEKEAFLLDEVLDIACYDVDENGEDELIVLRLDKKQKPDESHGAYGDKLQLYKLAIKDESLQLTLQYETAMQSQHPWCIEAGRLGGKEPYANIFVGVHKDTRFYQNVINRPFFLSWQGSFLKRRWTGSYLSTNEYVDIIFADMTGDGNDEVTALERRDDGTYIVSLYQWLSFGFEQIAVSKESYNEAELIAYEKPQNKEERPAIWVKEKEGCKIVRFI